MQIPFNKPYLSGKELEYIRNAVHSGKISGNGMYTQKCQAFFQEKYSFNKCLLTTSCTDALEMAAILVDINPGDEVIMPSYTFVSTANAFLTRGAVIRFVDSRSDHPGMDEDLVEELVNEKTKAIVPVHYAGVATRMNKLMQIADTHKLFVVEDAAQAIDSYFIHDGKRTPLGGSGHLAAFSFHETKNVIAGEGGMLVINDKQFEKRAEIIWEKGTNRTAFFRGEVDKYGWVDIGSSFLPSELVSAFLYAQVEQLADIQQRRLRLWQLYYDRLQPLFDNGLLQAPFIPDYATNNAHMFYVVCRSSEDRAGLLQQLKSCGIHAVFHYLSLHCSMFYQDKHDGRTLKNSDRYSDCLVRLPLFYELTEEQVNYCCDCVIAFFNKNTTN